MYRMFWSFGQKEIAFSKKYSTNFYWESAVCQKLLGIVGMMEKKNKHRLRVCFYMPYDLPSLQVKSFHLLRIF